MSFNIIIEGATIYDGSGNQPYSADIAVKDSRIAEIGHLNGAVADRRINGHDKVLCPGFIDVHSHADTVLHWDNHDKILEPLLRQGITTFVGGNCGLGLAPVKSRHRQEYLAYLDAVLGKNQEAYIKWETMGELMETLERQGTVINFALLAPHGIIRIACMGLHRGLPNREQMNEMKAMLAECLDSGVLGMSTGLQYFPGLSADEEELVELAKMLATKDAVFTCHLRSYSNTLLNAIDELMTVSRKSGARVQLSHLFWVPNFGRLVNRTIHSIARFGATIYKHIKIPVPMYLLVQRKLHYIDREIQKGLPMGIDAMPTGAGFTHAFAFFPPWAMEGTKQDIIKRVADKAVRKNIYKSIISGKSVWPHRDADTWSLNFFKVMGFHAIHLMSVVSEKNQKYIGKNFIQIGKERDQHPFDAICDMLLEEDGRVLVFGAPTWPGDEFTERSVYASIADPNVSIVTDTILIGHGRPSHLFYDCYPKLLSKYVRKEKRLTLAEAIRKSTSLPAKQLCISNRGEIKRGYWADLVLFDAEKIDTRSTPSKPDMFPTGVEYVLVNGYVIVSPDGYHPYPRPGRLIRRGEKY